MDPCARFPDFSWEWGELLLQTKFLVEACSWGICQQKIVEIGPTILVLKLNKARVLGAPPWKKVHIFFIHEDDIQSLQILVWSKIVSKKVSLWEKNDNTKTTSQ